jgi:hypothetical protein
MFVLLQLGIMAGREKVTQIDTKRFQLISTNCFLFRLRSRPWRILLVADRIIAPVEFTVWPIILIVGAYRKARMYLIG